MSIFYYLETLRHLRLTQIVHQLKHRFYRPQIGVESPLKANPSVAMLTEPIAKPCCYNSQGQFTFLNISDSFRDWNMNEHGPLWAYNLNYMDWLEQEGVSEDECLGWIDHFIDEIPSNHVGLDPYPIALRVINWAKFFTRHPKGRNKRRIDSMYAQTLLLERKLEYHLLGNHLLEDAYALFITSIFFGDERLFSKAAHLLEEQLSEQILPDGAHYEQSPMYHCIMLDRLLDCINFSANNQLFVHQETLTNTLKQKAVLMLGHLQSIIYSDGSIPLLNDSSFGIAPTASQLFDYAQKLNISWKPMPLRECGYRKLNDKGMEAILDIGNITVSYQPGHSHADTFNYELRIDGQPVIVDTGISTYNKDSRRQYERSTVAHNTVSVAGKDSSIVWGGFRMGRRAKVTIEKDSPTEILAHHDGFGHHIIHQRHFAFCDHAIHIEDLIIGKVTNAISYLHFSPQTDVSVVSETDGILKAGKVIIKAEGFNDIRLKTDYVSTEYNKLQPCRVLEISFHQQLRYSIKVT